MQLRLRRDSRSIALLAVFSAMTAMLEVFPIVGVTDLKVVPQFPYFTIDWTGIPIIFVAIGLGLVYSLITVCVMGVAIGYRNPIGATFKVAAETLTVLGFYIGGKIVSSRSGHQTVRFIVSLFLACLFRAAGMLLFNYVALPLFYGLPYDVALSVGVILFPWNALQSAINVIGGTVLYRAVPRDLALQAGLGEGNSIEEQKNSELEKD